MRVIMAVLCCSLMACSEESDPEGVGGAGAMSGQGGAGAIGAGGSGEGGSGDGGSGEGGDGGSGEGGSGEGGAGGEQCADTLFECGDECVDLRSSAAHCGSCNNDCSALPQAWQDAGLTSDLFTAECAEAECVYRCAAFESGPVATLEEAQACSGMCAECFSNLDCIDGTICLEDPMDPARACCVPGERGVDPPGTECGDDGQQTCASAICIEGDSVGRCSTPCETEMDCPPTMQRCFPLFEDQAWCLPTE